MERERVITEFNDLLSNQRDKICFSKGYEIYEEMYEEFKEYGLERQEKKEFGYTMVTVTLKRR